MRFKVRSQDLFRYKVRINEPKFFEILRTKGTNPYIF